MSSLKFKKILLLIFFANSWELRWDQGYHQGFHVGVNGIKGIGESTIFIKCYILHKIKINVT